MIANSVCYTHLITGENKLQSNEDSDLWYTLA